jgi:hypothetical protein
MLDTLKPGQNITCTVTKAPRTEDQKGTIERLMRRDPVAAKGLRKSQRARRQGMVVYNRGNRDWYKREHCSKIVRAVQGATWSMPYTLDLAHDFEAVRPFVTVKAS